MSNNTYIPSNLEEAVNHVIQNMDKDSIEAIKKSTSMHEFHFTTGMAMRNDWGLWSGSSLRSWFVDRGIDHADDMSGIIMKAIWCRVQDEDFNLDQEIAKYQEYWSKVKNDDVPK